MATHIDENRYNIFSKDNEMKNIFNRFKKKLNILVIGSDGMLGHDVYEYYTKLSQLKDTNIGKVFGIDRTEGQPMITGVQIYDFMERSVHFDVCINCAAYTDTKGAEEPYVDNFHKSKKRLSYELNAELPYWLALSCKQHKTKLIHISSDYVFSEVDSYRYENVIPTPKNVYGEHKYIGELHIKNIFGEKSKDYAILRTSWLYGAYNSKSFVHKFLLNTFRCINEGKEDQIEMTSNEQSVPTSVWFLVQCINYVINNGEYGVMHAVPTTSSLINDEVTRLQFAKCILKYLNVEIADICPKRGGDTRRSTDIEVKPVERHTYAPTVSSMETSFSDAVFCRCWEDDLREFINANYYKLVKWLKAQFN